MSGDMKTFSVAKMMILVFALACIVGVSIALFWNSKSKSEEWVELGENFTGVLLYDKGSVRRYGNGEVTVRTKHIFSPEMCRTLAESSEGLVRASHYASLDKINCRKWEYEQVKIVFKDFYGKKIDWPGSKKDRPGQADYRPIPPNTLIGRLAEVVCEISDAERNRQ